jgi:hypothetical protein
MKRKKPTPEIITYEPAPARDSLKISAPEPVTLPLWVGHKITEHGLPAVSDALREALRKRLQDELYACTRDMSILELQKLVQDLK